MTFRRFLAYFRLSKRAVCEESRGKRDYHDWPDSTYKAPCHFINHFCRRCGKGFTI